ncbi:MAG: DUF1016 family protein [Opitutales bacterium]|nr:DUF1016 family protein [Opitutales bacterium]
MNYDALIQSIRKIHSEAKAGAAGAVNRHLILRNWLIGAYLVEFEQGGNDRAEYGNRLLKNVAQDLKKTSVPGSSIQMLERMRAFYLCYPQLKSLKSPSLMRIFGKPLNSNTLKKSSTVLRISSPSTPPPLEPASVLRLSWSHLIELIRIDDPWKRAFYENESLKGNWSVRQLQRQIGSLLYERTALSTDKKTVIQAGRSQATEAPLTMDSLIRDPYVLEFTGLAERPHYLESELEKALLDHLQAFLLELGNGFCFEARQKRVTVGNEHDYIDLLFYHRRLRCHLLVDLKIRPFQHGDAGQMNFYLNFWKENMMEPDDNLPIGLLLCADRDHTKVQYATSGMNQQLFVSRYLTKLPSPEEIRALIERDQAVFEEQAAYNTQPLHAQS